MITENELLRELPYLRWRLRGRWARLRDWMLRRTQPPMPEGLGNLLLRDLPEPPPRGTLLRVKLPDEDFRII